MEVKTKVEVCGDKEAEEKNAWITPGEVYKYGNGSDTKYRLGILDTNNKLYLVRLETGYVFGYNIAESLYEKVKGSFVLED